MKAIETLKTLSVVILVLHALVVIGAIMLAVYLLSSDATMGLMFPMGIGVAAAYAAIPWLLVYVFADLAKNVLAIVESTARQSKSGFTITNIMAALNDTSTSIEERQWDICDRLEGIQNAIKDKEKDHHANPIN